MRIRTLILVAVAATCILACDQRASVDKASEEAAIRAVAEGSMLRAAREGNLVGVLDAYSESAIMMPPGAPSQRRRAELESFWRSFLELPDIDIKRMDETSIQVAASGDMAYSIGGYDLSFVDEEGNAQSDQGKHVRVWEKGPDGSWKIVVDIWNANK